MPNCIVKGCKHRTGQKEKHPTVVLHSFPSDLYYIKQWLLQTKQDFGDIDAFAKMVLDYKKNDGHRLCSLHFTSSCYTARGSKLVLKKDAIPTIFPGDEDKFAEETDEPPVKIFIQVDGTVEKSIQCVDASSQTNPRMGVKSLGTSTNSKYLKRNVLLQTYVPYEADVGIQCGGEDEIKTIKLEPELGVVIENQSQSTSFSTSSAQAHSTHNSTQIKEEDFDRLEEYYRPLEAPSKTTADYPKIEPTVGTNRMVIKEEEYKPEPYTVTEPDKNFKRDPSEGSMNDRKVESRLHCDRVSVNNVDERKFLVFDSSLEKLFYRVQCGAGMDCTSPVARVEKKIVGSFLTVTGYCLSGHEFKIWDSQPV
ncbi:uncharacterized protein WCC33_016170 [Rhinophrynus dorsalis]